MKKLFLLINLSIAFLFPLMGSAQAVVAKHDSLRTNAATQPDTAVRTTIMEKSAQYLNIDFRSVDETQLYPNPALNEINLIYSAGADVKSIAVYNIIGRVMTVYRVTDNSSANLNLESIPSGIYFVRLFNSNGETVVTKKFTKQ